MVATQALNSKFGGRGWLWGLVLKYMDPGAASGLFTYVSDPRVSANFQRIRSPHSSVDEYNSYMSNKTKGPKDLSPVFTVPVLPQFAPVKTSRYTVINRGTVPTKIDHVLIITVLPGCSHGLGPGSIVVSSRCRPVCPGFTTVCPGGVPVCPSPATVFACIENVSNRVRPRSPRFY